MSRKKKLLVFASTFPRWENDTIPPFVWEKIVNRVDICAGGVK